MIDQRFLKEYTTKSQTNLDNVLREFLQHTFLRHFYSQKQSANFLFKGGTALKLVFNSPRFSEDLDFSGTKKPKIYENILENTVYALLKEGVKFDIEESKSTSGGYMAILKTSVFDQQIQLQNHISFRTQSLLKSKTMLVASEISPTYTINLLHPKQLVIEKVEALLTRKKARDFFDLYFILRNPQLRSQLELEPDQRTKILALTNKQNKKTLANELKRLLPKSFWAVASNLPSILTKELFLS